MKRISTSNNFYAAHSLGRKQSLHLIWIISLVSLVMVGVTTHASVTYAKNDSLRVKRYTSLQVEEGDSLWSIAGEHLSEEYRSMDQYILEVKRINHISGDEIHSGAYLVIPYYTNR